MGVEYTFPKCNIVATGVTKDGQAFTLSTQGEIVIRTKKKPWEDEEYSFRNYHCDFPTAPEYEMVVDLKYDAPKDSVYTIKVEKTWVKRSVTADFGPGVEIDALRERLGVPANAEVSSGEYNTSITFTWEEQV